MNFFLFFYEKRTSCNYEILTWLITCSTWCSSVHEKKMLHNNPFFVCDTCRILFTGLFSIEQDVKIKKKNQFPRRASTDQNNNSWYIMGIYYSCYAISVFWSFDSFLITIIANKFSKTVFSVDFQQTWKSNKRHDYLLAHPYWKARLQSFPHKQISTR